MRLTFDTYGNDKQKQCAKAWIDNNITEIIYGGAKGGSKSFTGCKLIFHDALVYPGTHYFIARKELNDLRKFTIPSIHECFETWGLRLSDYATFNGQDSMFNINNNSKVYLIAAKYLPSDPMYQRYGSMQMTRGWIEEAGEFEEDAKNNLSASVGRWMNDVYSLAPKILQTCNPSKNYLYRDYKKFREGNLEPYKAFIQALPTDNNKLPKGYIEQLYRSLSPVQIERLINGNWEYDDDSRVLMTYDKILEIFTNEFVEPNNDKYLVADIAYEGSDIFVIGIWHGLVLMKIIAMDKCDETQVSKIIHENRVKEGIPLGNVLYDADGIKKFVKQSAASGYLNGAKQFHNNSKALNDENFFNLKSQCYFKLSNLINSNKIYIFEKNFRKQIIEELEQIRKIENADDGKLRIEKKEDLKLRLRRSPDFADMIMMRMLFEIKPKIKQTFATVEGRVYEHR